MLYREGGGRGVLAETLNLIGGIAVGIIGGLVSVSALLYGLWVFAGGVLAFTLLVVYSSVGTRAIARSRQRLTQRINRLRAEHNALTQPEEPDPPRRKKRRRSCRKRS